MIPVYMKRLLHLVPIQISLLSLNIIGSYRKLKAAPALLTVNICIHSKSSKILDMNKRQSKPNAKHVLGVHNDSEWFEGEKSQKAENKKMKRREMRKVPSSTKDLKEPVASHKNGKNCGAVAARSLKSTHTAHMCGGPKSCLTKFSSLHI